MSDLLIRGIAAPFGSFGHLDGKRETFKPGAFFWTPSDRIDLRVDHDGRPFASTSDRTLELRQGRHGLMFQAHLAGDAFSRLAEMRRGRLGASVNMPAYQSERLPHLVDGQPAVLVTTANLDHIALLSAPAYRETSAWLASWDVEDLPSWIQNDAARWAEDWHASSADFSPAMQAQNRAVERAPAGKNPRHPDAVWHAQEGVWKRPMASARSAVRGTAFNSVGRPGGFNPVTGRPA